MKRRTLIVVGTTILLILCGFSLSFIDTTSAKYDDDIIVSFESNSGWILSKTTRKLLFLRYTDENVVWTTRPLILPPEIDVNNCILDCTGSRGIAAFLYDRTSHMIYLFQALKDRSIMQYVRFDAKANLK